MYYLDKNLYRTASEVVNLKPHERMRRIEHRAAGRRVEVRIDSSPTLSAYAYEAHVAVYLAAAPRTGLGFFADEFRPAFRYADNDGSKLPLAAHATVPKSARGYELASALAPGHFRQGQPYKARCWYRAPRQTQGYEAAAWSGSALTLTADHTSSGEHLIRFTPRGFLALRCVDAQGGPMPWVEGVAVPASEVAAVESLLAAAKDARTSTARAAVARGGGIEIDAEAAESPWHERYSKLRGTDEGYVVCDLKLDPDREYVLYLWSNSRDDSSPDRRIRFTARLGVTDLGSVVLPAYDAQ